MVAYPTIEVRVDSDYTRARRRAFLRRVRAWVFGDPADRAFLPGRGHHGGRDLPPVTLFGPDDSCFVEDSNHRVSVARFQGIGWVDAEVTILQGGIYAVPAQGHDAEAMEQDLLVAPLPVAA